MSATGTDQETIEAEFQGDRILLRFPNYRSAVGLQRRHLSDVALGSISKVISFIDLQIYAQIGERKPFELYPKPGWLIRLLSPQLRRLIRS